MRPNLPKNATLKKKIGRKEVQSPLHFLSNHRGELAPYRTVEDLVFNLDGPHPTAIDTIEVHLRKVSWKFRKSRYSYSISKGSVTNSWIGFRKPGSLQVSASKH